MRNHKFLFSLAIGLSLAAASVGYFGWRSSDALVIRERMLELAPADSKAVIFIDLAQFRSSPFLLELLERAPRPAPESDYAQFVEATGFDYERDLDRLAISISRQGSASRIVAIADGRFDRKKIETYGAKFGALKSSSGKTIYAVPMAGPSRNAFFSFLRDDRIAWSSDAAYFAQPRAALSSADWREHFLRLAGTPIFAVLHEDPDALGDFAQHAPGGLSSPQLASLLGQLQWISIGGKPEGNLLRVVLDGECISEGTIGRLKEMLGGIVVLAQMGLNDPKTSKQLDPRLRQAYLELLESADIQQLDRGSSKSVRVIVDVTPKLFEAARTAPAEADPPPPAPAASERPASRKRKK
jgi:hypothetical protein